LLVAGDRWLVIGGWWLVVGDQWLVIGELERSVDAMTCRTRTRFIVGVRVPIAL
jgi:hypothetical protein